MFNLEELGSVTWKQVIIVFLVVIAVRTGLAIIMRILSNAIIKKEKGE